MELSILEAEGRGGQLGIVVVETDHIAVLSLGGGLPAFDPVPLGPEAGQILQKAVPVRDDAGGLLHLEEPPGVVQLDQELGVRPVILFRILEAGSGGIGLGTVKLLVNLGILGHLGPPKNRFRNLGSLV